MINQQIIIKIAKYRCRIISIYHRHLSIKLFQHVDKTAPPRDFNHKCHLAGLGLAVTNTWQPRREGHCGPDYGIDSSSFCFPCRRSHTTCCPSHEIGTLSLYANVSLWTRSSGSWTAAWQRALSIGMGISLSRLSVFPLASLWSRGSSTESTNSISSHTQCGAYWHWTKYDLSAAFQAAKHPPPHPRLRPPLPQPGPPLPPGRPRHRPPPAQDLRSHLPVQALGHVVPQSPPSSPSRLDPPNPPSGPNCPETVASVPWSPQRRSKTWRKETSACRAASEARRVNRTVTTSLRSTREPYRWLWENTPADTQIHKYIQALLPYTFLHCHGVQTARFHSKKIV